MAEQCSAKREVSNNHALNILRDQLASLHVAEIRSIRSSAAISHFQRLAINDKFKLRLDGQPFDLPASLQKVQLIAAFRFTL